jgi:spore coat polysaccharide biosynthesis protein SpsF (cytidylyltransferase family)/sialic acid synthase SpsE
MYNILEIANTHGGNVQYIYELLNEFKSLDKSKGFGIKFQPFKYDESALEDFSYYEIYKELFISSSDWKNILDEAYKTKDIWIDLFDDYGIDIFKSNIDKVHGIKLQTSVLENNLIFESLEKCNLKNKKLILNIAGRSKEEIDLLLQKYLLLDVGEILFEVGFQSFPTKLEDAGLSKVLYLKNRYSNKLVFADHNDGESDDAKLLPLIASMLGADYIEKHIMHSSLETKYDFNSSITYKTFHEFLHLQEKYLPLLHSPFVSEPELDYLNKTYQVPVLNKDKKSYTLINMYSDVKYRRSDKVGLHSKALNDLTSNYYLLNKNKKENDTLCKEDFKKANIAAIIACRLKSTRLPKKALLNIGALSSIELCIKNTLKFNHLNHVVLATSTIDQDAELEDYTYSDNVIFHQGHPDDVIERYLDVIDDFKIDIFVRLTGDNAFISSEIFDYLLKSHFDNGADYTTAKAAAVGTNLEIINASALKKVKSHFPFAEHSEYMSWYFHNNPEYFNINFVDLPKHLVREYRLTLDYPEDLEMFNKIEDYFSENNLQYSLSTLFDFLDKNPEIASINSHLTPKYESNRELIDMLDRETKIS